MTPRGRGPAQDGEAAVSDPGEWVRKGATLSDGTACREFGLTREQIVDGLRRGDLQYRVGSCHGNPFLRLLRGEVEALARQHQGGKAIEERRVRADLARVDRELRALRRRMATLEKERARLIAGLGGR